MSRVTSKWFNSAKDLAGLYAGEWIIAASLSMLVIVVLGSVANGSVNADVAEDVRMISGNWVR